MPRLTTQQFLARRHWLVRVWLENQDTFGWLSSRQQGALHEFFRPAELLTDQEAITHRQQCSQVQPSLPAVAGRAYQVLVTAQQAWRQAPAPVALGRRNHRLTVDQLHVRAIRRPQPDFKRLARAIYLIAEEEVRRQNIKD